MANNPYWVAETLYDSHGISESMGSGTSATPILTEARVLVDDTFIAGILDLGPYLAAITDPSIVIIDIAVGRATISYDGITYSLFDISHTEIRFSGTGVPATVWLTLNAPSRVRVWAYGD